jgi:hypothetical protein
LVCFEGAAHPAKAAARARPRIVRVMKISWKPALAVGRAPRGLSIAGVIVVVAAVSGAA